MGTVDKLTFEGRGARGCSNSDYNFAVTTCCKHVAVVDDELHDFYWDADDLSRVIGFFRGYACPVCRSATWDFEPLSNVGEIPEDWRWACHREISFDSDRERPRLHVGDRVRVVLNQRNRTPHEGTIARAIWHFKYSCWHYYLEEDGRKIPKRYTAEDLLRL